MDWVYCESEPSKASSAASSALSALSLSRLNAKKMKEKTSENDKIKSEKKSRKENEMKNFCWETNQSCDCHVSYSLTLLWPLEQWVRWLQ